MKPFPAFMATMIALFCIFTFTGCGSGPAAQGGNGVVPDTVMIKLLFPPGRDIFTGGDGAISIPVSDGKSVWIWGDSFMGYVEGNSRIDSIANPLIYGNIFTELDGTRARTISRGTPQHPEPIIYSDSVDGKQAVYWPHHGIVRNGILHTYMIDIVFDPVLWFYPNTVSYIRLSLPDYEIIDIQDIDSWAVNEIWYGFGIYELDGYYYSYGGTDSRELHVSRGKLVDDRLQDWEYFDGTGWTPDASKTRQLAGVDIKISTQFSVFPHGDKFILITQDGDNLSNDIYSFVADTPTGPWRNKKLLYTVPEPSPDNNLYSYNAMAHPQYDEDGRLLVSYCINSSVPQDIWDDVTIYRPRFLRVPYSLILE